MALFRKDLKVGFAVGAVVLVGGVAYLLFSGGDDRTAAATDPLANPDPLAVAPTPPVETPAMTNVASTPANSLLAAAGNTPAQSWGDALAGRQPLITTTPGTLPPDTAETAATPDLNENLRGAFNDLKADLATGGAGRPTSPAPTIVMPPSPRPAGATVHTVEQGDNFSTLAKKYLGDGNLYLLVAAANPGVDSSRLKLGQTVNIPDRAAVDAAKAGKSSARTSAAPSAASSTPADSGLTHVVAAGETLHSIAERRLGRGALWKDIYDLNRVAIGDDPEDLPVGLTLRLPK